MRNLPETFLAEARALLGDAEIRTDAAALAPHLVETRGLVTGEAAAVIAPRSTMALAALMALAQRHHVPVVAQGGNTGLVGGGLPFGGIVVSLARLNEIGAVDAVNATITVGAGAILADVQTAARAAGFLFPLSLGSEGSCTIGGNIATNAGGTAVLRYGNMRDLVLGLEAVLADGRVFDDLGGLRKDNAGFGLRHLFIGTEGTLGLVTRAVLKLFPLPGARATALVGAGTPAQIVRLFERLRAVAGESLTTFEIIPRFGLEIVIKHALNTRDPLSAPHAQYAMIELSAPVAGRGLDDHLAEALGGALEAGEIDDAAMAASEAQRADFWRLREHLSDCQRHEGGSIKHDVSVPISQVADFIATAGAACAAALPGIRVCAFGHIGDGNIHFNLSQPVGMDKDAFLRDWRRFNRLVHDEVHRRGGSIAAEHGVGLFKRDELPAYKDPVTLDLMVTLKRALDPANILNPGKVVRIGGDLPGFDPGA